MSNALWCDQGGHPYSERDPKRQHFTRSEYDEDGNSISAQFDICGPCAVKIKFGAPALAPTDGDA
jgi:hypothetical protein